MTMSNNNLEKKTKGRRKIEIQKINNRNSLQVTFSKRRTGLFKKAKETSLLCGANVTILIQSPGNKFFTFGEPSVESILNRYQFLDDSFSAESNPTAHNLVVEEKSENGEATTEFWWQNENLETMGLQELEVFGEKLNGLRENFLNQVVEMEKQIPSVSWPMIPVLPQEGFNANFDAV